MNPPLGRVAEPVYALFRIVLGTMFLMHGGQKLLGWFPVPDRPAPDAWTVGWIGGVLELVLGALIVIGLFAGWAAFFASGEMAVAFFGFHFKAERPFPIQNSGELAVAYCFAFLYIAAKGAGIWSVDSARRRPSAVG
jgi:putative oxidoreductase